jgi:cell division septation protein DedD
MSDTPIRRSNWTAQPGSNAGPENDDPLAELERIVGRGGNPTSLPDIKPAPSQPQGRKDDFLGFSETEFEAAFRSLEKQPSSSPPVREGAVLKKEPVFEEPSRADFSRSFAQTFKEEIAANAAQRPANPEFETRADNFDFDKRAINATRTAQENFKGGYESEDSYSESSYEEPHSSYLLEPKARSGFVTVIAVTGLVFVAVIGALIYSWVGTKNTGEPIVIKADTSPVKKMAAADAEQPSTNKLIYDRLGNSDEDANNEKLVSREEQPVENLQTQPAPLTGNASNPATSAQVNAQDSQSGTMASPRVILPNPSSQETASLNPPRQVTTTTIHVRPDGTMENIPSRANTSSAANAPSAATLKTDTSSVPAANPKTMTAPAPIQATVPSEADPMVNSMTAETETPAPIKKPVPVRTPAKTSSSAAPQRVASAIPTTRVNSPSPSKAALDSGFVVQVSSQKNEASARSTFTSLQSRFPQVLSSYQPSIKAVTLGNRGTYYRVRVGPLASRDEASALCGRLKAAGGDCVVTPN